MPYSLDAHEVRYDAAAAAPACKQLAQALETVWGSMEVALIKQDASLRRLARYYQHDLPRLQSHSRSCPACAIERPSPDDINSASVNGEGVNASVATLLPRLNVSAYGEYQPFRYAFTPTLLPVVCRIGDGGGAVCVQESTPCGLFGCGSTFIQSPIFILLMVLLGCCLVSAIMSACTQSSKGGGKSNGVKGGYGGSKGGYGGQAQKFQNPDGSWSVQNADGSYVRYS